jgi:hypothetical protein
MARAPRPIAIAVLSDIGVEVVVVVVEVIWPRLGELQ